MNVSWESENTMFQIQSASSNQISRYSSPIRFSLMPARMRRTRGRTRTIESGREGGM